MLHGKSGAVYSTSALLLATSICNGCNLTRTLDKIRYYCANRQTASYIRPCQVTSQKFVYQAPHEQQSQKRHSVLDNIYHTLQQQPCPTMTLRNQTSRLL